MSVVKELLSSRTHWACLCSLPNVDSPCGPPVGKGCRGEVWSVSFVSQGAAYDGREGYSRKRGKRSWARAFSKLVVAARKERFGATPGRAVVMRRTWQMNPYSYSSTVFRTSRETLRIFSAKGPGVGDGLLETGYPSPGKVSK